MIEDYSLLVLSELEAGLRKKILFEPLNEETLDLTKDIIEKHLGVKCNNTNYNDKTSTLDIYFENIIVRISSSGVQIIKTKGG